MKDLQSLLTTDTQRWYVMNLAENDAHKSSGHQWKKKLLSGGFFCFVLFILRSEMNWQVLLHFNSYKLSIQDGGSGEIMRNMCNGAV